MLRYAHITVIARNLGGANFHELVGHYDFAGKKFAGCLCLNMGVISNTMFTDSVKICKCLCFHPPMFPAAIDFLCHEV